jgi:hypothetical protein
VEEVLLEEAKPLNPDGSERHAPVQLAAREDAIVRLSHDLSDSVRRVAGGRCEYVRVTTRQAGEARRSQAGSLGLTHYLANERAQLLPGLPRDLRAVPSAASGRSLTILGPGPFFPSDLEPSDVSDLLDWLAEHEPSVGSRAEADRLLDELRREVGQAIACEPGIELRAAYLEQVQEELEVVLDKGRLPLLPYTTQVKLDISARIRGYTFFSWMTMGEPHGRAGEEHHLIG